MVISTGNGWYGTRANCELNQTQLVRGGQAIWLISIPDPLQVMCVKTVCMFIRSVACLNCEPIGFCDRLKLTDDAVPSIPALSIAGGSAAGAAAGANEPPSKRQKRYQRRHDGLLWAEKSRGNASFHVIH